MKSSNPWMRLTTVVFCLCMGGQGARADVSDDVKATFREFVGAQNAHDLASAGRILADSADVLWVAPGRAVVGRGAVLEGFQANYAGTWTIQPDFDRVEVRALAPGVAQLWSPASIAYAPPGQAAVAKRFELVQIFVASPGGWKLTSIVTVPSPQ